MPSIQVDLPCVPAPAATKELARRFGVIYADDMGAASDLLTVSVHGLPGGGVWRCHGDGEPTPSALIMCDIRGGRPVATRERLARDLVEACAEMFELDTSWIKVEFTQHAGDEMYHPHLGGFNKDWTGDERGGEPRSDEEGAS